MENKLYLIFLFFYFLNKKIIYKPYTEEEIKKNESVVVDKNKNATVMFDSPNSKPPGASTQASDPVTSVEQNVVAFSLINSLLYPIN